MTETLTHRQSGMLQYVRCGEKFRRKREEWRPSGVSMLRGTGVHAGAAHNFRQKIESHQDLKRDDIIDVSIASFDNKLEEEGCTLAPEEKSRGEKTVIGEERDRVWRLAALQADQLAPLVQPVAVEQTIIANFDTHGFKFRGTLDLKDELRKIIDIKSARKKKPKNEQHKDFQLTTYACLNFIATKQMPSSLELNVLVDKKTPEMQILTTTRTVEDFEVWFRYVVAVDKAIRAGVFPPANKSDWWCAPKWCEYWTDCIYWSDAERARMVA